MFRAAIWLVFGGGVLGCLLAVPATVRAQPCGTLVDVDTPVFGSFSRANDINNVGQIVGQRDDQAFLWTPNVPNGSAGTMVDLGLFQAGEFHSAINDLGQVALSDYFGADSLFHSFLWNPSTPNSSSGQMSELGIFEAFSINGRGQVAGCAPGGAFGCHALVWNPDAPNETSGTIFRIPGPSDAQAVFPVKINDLGEVARTVVVSDGSLRIFLWIPETPNGITGTTVNIPAPSYCVYSTAAGINNLGEIAGNCGHSDGSTTALLWRPDVANRTTGVTVDLGTLNFFFFPNLNDFVSSTATGINAQGQVTGYSTTSDGYDNAFLWSPATPNGISGSMVNLLDHLGYPPVDAAAVNNRDQVTGSGLFPVTVGFATENAFVWMPPLEVAVAIKPGDAVPAVNLDSTTGTVPVAILSSTSFNATLVNPLTVELAGSSAASTPAPSFTDVNGDKRVDLLLHFTPTFPELGPTSTQADLCGQTFDGTKIHGKGAVKVVAK